MTKKVKEAARKRMRGDSSSKGAASGLHACGRRLRPRRRHRGLDARARGRRARGVEAAALARPSSPRSAQSALRRPPSTQASTRCRLCQALPDSTLMGVEDLRDQLKKHRLLDKSKMFLLFLPNRTAYVLQLQTLLLETNEDANDLEDGNIGIEGRSVRRRATG
eukprot:1574975-Pleurochrysis_carterae.AAC.7